MSHQKVLIAEDDYLVSQMIRGLLEETGYDVIGEATNGLEAIEMTQSLQPDVVLMDVKMPDMDGIEATRQIQERCPTPVVVLTAYETPELVKRASAAGVGAYLVKPLQAPEIERAITVAVARFEDLIELCRVNAELEERNAALKAFAHTVAHDLKSQLAPLIGYAEVLETDFAASLGVEGLIYLNSIHRIAHKMNNVTEELLLLAEVPAVEAPIAPLDMAAIVKEARERLIYMIEEHQAEIVISHDGPWPKVLGYGPWVEEVWINYLSNGLKYGGRPEEGIAPRLEIGFSKGTAPAATASGSPDQPADQKEWWRFWIKDNGPGIPPSQQAQLFVPFAQIHHFRAKGHGLGLSIVRHIVEKLGGQVGIDSTEETGSTFWFTLPAAPD